MAGEKELRIHGASECWPEDVLEREHDHWLIVRTLPRQEKKLAADARCMGCAGCMFYEQRIHRYKHKGVYKSLVPLISGYCFLAAGPAWREQIFATERVLAIHNVSGPEAGIFGHELDNLRRVLQTYEGRPLLQPQIQAGDEIEIRCGTFAGCRGVVSRRKGQLSLVVNLHLLDRSISVDLPATTAELADLPW